MSASFTLFDLITYAIICVTNSQWISPSSTLNNMDHMMVVGVHNATIFILGGWVFPRQMTEFHIETETFTPMTQTLPNDVKAFGQSWSQLDEMMYMIVGSTLSTFDMITKQYTNAWIDLNTDVGGMEGCLAAVNGQIFVTGGYVSDRSIDTLQVLNVASLQWISNTPPMQTKRCEHACVVHYNYLWVFGGWNEIISALKTNERIDITDITSNQWDFIGGLSDVAYAFRAVAWQQSVFVTGGYQGNTNNIYLDTVHVADGITGEVVLAPERLVYKVIAPGIVSIHNVIYLFGGSNSVSGYVDTWMRYGQLPTIMPTSVPTTADPTTPAPITADPTSSAPTTDNPTTANPTTADPTSSAPTTGNPTTARPTTTDLPSSAPNDMTSSMPPTVDQTTSMPSIAVLSTEQTPSDASTMTSRFLSNLPTSPDSNADVTLVMILSPVVIVVLLICLCGSIAFLQKKRVKTNVDFIASDPVNDNSNRCTPVNVQQTKSKASMPLEGVGMTIEGKGTSANQVQPELLVTKCYDVVIAKVDAQTDRSDSDSERLYGGGQTNDGGCQTRTKGQTRSQTRTKGQTRSQTRTKGQVQTTEANENVLEEIDGEGQHNVDMRYIQEGPTDIVQNSTSFH